MISRDTATDIALAYREIETGEKLLVEVSEAIDRAIRGNPDLRDAFGRPAAGLELGVPSRNEHGTSTRLFNVPWSIAKTVIQAHIADRRNVLAALTDKARIELAANP